MATPPQRPATSRPNSHLPPTVRFLSHRSALLNISRRLAHHPHQTIPIAPLFQDLVGLTRRLTAIARELREGDTRGYFFRLWRACMLLRRRVSAVCDEYHVAADPMSVNGEILVLVEETVKLVEDFERKTEGVEGRLMGEVERREGEKRRRERVKCWVDFATKITRMLGFTLGTFVAFAVASYTCRFPGDSLNATRIVVGWIYAWSFEAVENCWVILFLFFILIIQKGGDLRKSKALFGRNRT